MFPLEKKVIRMGGILLILAGIASISGLIFHPSTIPSISNTHLEAIAGSEIWIPLHLLIFVARILYVCGLFVFLTLLTTQAGKAFGFLGFIFILLGTAVSGVLVTLDGFVIKSLANSWMQSSGSEQLMQFYTLSAFEQLELKLFNTFVVLYFGIGFALYGIAARLEKKSFLKAVLTPVVSAIILVFIAFYHLLFQFTLISTAIMTVALIIQNLWMIMTGFLITKTHA